MNRSRVISASNNASNQNVSLTLPITCQICLGRVKDPSVCPNLHVFCAGCINLWLEKSKQCPTCRIDISAETPCKLILGGIENLDDVDQLRPSHFSHQSVRKARYLNIFEQYEDEINRLSKYIDSLNEDIAKYKENDNSKVSMTQDDSSLSSGCLKELNAKLSHTQAILNETQIERDSLKEINKKLESENSILMQDIIRLKANLSEKNSQISNRYTVAALETKIEAYEKEIKKLQKALERSDKYIADLEQSKGLKHISLDESQKNSTLCENEPSSTLIGGSALLSSTSMQNLNLKQGIITKDNFYGSPSKMASNNSTTSANSISSFSDRLKKMSSQNNQTFESSQQTLLSNKQSNIDNSTNIPCGNWFSPMKKLRLEENSLEKSSFNGEDTINCKNYLVQNIDSVFSLITSNDSKEHSYMSSQKAPEQDRNHDTFFTNSFTIPTNNYAYTNLTSFPSYLTSNNMNTALPSSIFESDFNQSPGKNPH